MSTPFDNTYNEMLERGWQDMKLRLDREMPIIGLKESLLKLALSLSLLCFVFLSHHDHSIIVDQSPQLPTPIESNLAITTLSSEYEKSESEISNELAIETSHTDEPQLSRNDAIQVDKRSDSKKREVSSSPQRAISQTSNTFISQSKQKKPLIKDNLQSQSIQKTVKQTVSFENIGIETLSALPSLKTTKLNVPKIGHLAIPSVSELPETSRWSFGIGGITRYLVQNKELGYGVFGSARQSFKKVKKFSLDYRLGLLRRNVTTTSSDRNDSLALGAGDGGFNVENIDEGEENAIRHPQMAINEVNMSLLAYYQVSPRVLLGIGATSLYITNEVDKKYEHFAEARVSYRINPKLQSDLLLQKNKETTAMGLTLNYMF